MYSIFSQFYKFLFDLTLNFNNNWSYNCVTDSKEGSEDGDLEHELQDWEKEVINPNNHAELKVPINGVSILFIRFLYRGREFWEYIWSNLMIRNSMGLKAT